jgi:hypothetical protein
MKTIPRWPVFIFGMSTLFFIACNLTGSVATEEVNPGFVVTAAAQTVEAQLTLSAPGTAVPPTAAIPTATATPDNASMTQSAFACLEAAPNQLEVGGTAVVIVFQVNLRAEPGLNAPQVEVLARNRTVQVQDGPRCADGLWWWEVYNDDLEISGWVVEADEENYYLEP